MTRGPYNFLFRINGSLNAAFKRVMQFKASSFSKRFSSNHSPGVDGSIKTRWQRFKEEVPKAYEGIKKDLSDPSYVLFNVSLLIGFIGSCLPEELYLRYCAVLSASGAIVYNTFMFHGTKFVPNLTMVAWDVFRAAAHSSNIVRIWHEKSDIGMSEKQEKIYALHFMDFGMRPRQFMKLLHSSKGEAVFGSRECLVQQGEASDSKSRKLYLLLKGTVNAEVNGQVITTFTADSPLCFFGETQLLDLAEHGVLHRKLMKSPFVDMYDRTRIIAHRHDRKRGGGDAFDPSDILGFTPEEMDMEEAGLFRDDMEQEDTAATVNGDDDGSGQGGDGQSTTASTTEVGLSVVTLAATDTATAETTQAAEAQVSMETVSSSQVVAPKPDAHTSSLMSYVVPEGTTARVLIWDRDFVLDMIRRDDDFATQFKLVLYAAVRMKLKVLALLTFEKVYKALVTGCLSDGIVNALEKHALESYRREHNISDEMHESIILQCGWSLQEYKQGAKKEKLHEDKVISSLISNYDGLLHGIVSDGVVNAIERKALEMHRSDNNINDKYHAKALARLGWTLEDFERGFKLPIIDVQSSDVSQSNVETPPK